MQFITLCYVTLYTTREVKDVSQNFVEIRQTPYSSLYSCVATVPASNIISSDVDAIINLL